MKPTLVAALLLTSAAQAQVTPARLEAARAEPANWLTYSGNLGGQRYSPLRQITPVTIAGLRPAWIYQATAAGVMQTSPVVVDGVMYLTEFQGHVVALDARSGRVLWRYQQELPEKLLTLGFGPTNRGVAVRDSTVYVGRPGCPPDRAGRPERGAPLGGPGGGQCPRLCDHRRAH